MSHGTSRHGAGCECARCRGFQPGNGAALKHGAFATLRLQPRATEIAEELAALLPDLDVRHGPALQLCGMALARIEAAEAAGEGVPTRELIGWVNSAKRLMESFGLTPLSDSRVELTRALTDRARAIEGSGVPTYAELEQGA